MIKFFFLESNTYLNSELITMFINFRDANISPEQRRSSTLLSEAIEMDTTDAQKYINQSR